MKILTKRAYEKPSKSDGRRILIDRLWPRGISKEGACIDFWAKAAAPAIGSRGPGSAYSVPPRGRPWIG